MIIINKKLSPKAIIKKTIIEKYSFKKGTQFLILNNPVLREKEYFENPNKFIPERWTPEMEQSYYAISFNQGPQRCPGKELAIYLNKTIPQIIAVTKTFPSNKIIPLLETGHIHFGENKIQEAEIKWPILKEKYKNVQLHMIVFCY